MFAQGEVSRRQLRFDKRDRNLFHCYDSAITASLLYAKVEGRVQGQLPKQKREEDKSKGETRNTKMVSSPRGGDL
jgi:hypothetical protein